MNLINCGTAEIKIREIIGLKGNFPAFQCNPANFSPPVTKMTKYKKKTIIRSNPVRIWNESMQHIKRYSGFVSPGFALNPKNTLYLAKISLVKNS
jgi:hypothetical protein